jgi:hypothetical protein
MSLVANTPPNDVFNYPDINNTDIVVCLLNLITVARGLNETDTVTKAGGTLIWGSHRPPQGVANVKPSVANDETGFKVLTLTL